MNIDVFLNDEKETLVKLKGANIDVVENNLEIRDESGKLVFISPMSKVLYARGGKC
jgi:hypothetical protein